MKVAPLPLPINVTQAGVQSGSARATQWRQALERAEWQLTQQRATRSAAAAASQENGPATPATHPRAAASCGSDHEAADGRGRELGEAAADGAASAPAETARAAAPGPVAAADAAPEGMRLAAAPSALPTAAGASGPAAEVLAGPPAAPAAMPIPTPPPAALLWPLVNAHVHVQGREVSAALRDTSLSADEADELHHRLARRLANDGLQLTELRVNGRVAGDPTS